MRPEAAEIVGVSGPVADGSVVSLMCKSKGSRPAAWINWYNGSTPLGDATSEDVALMVRF